MTLLTGSKSPPDCAVCGGWTGEDPALRGAREFPPGSAGAMSALTSYSGKRCGCGLVDYEGKEAS